MVIERSGTDMELPQVRPFSPAMKGGGLLVSVQQRGERIIER